MRTYLQLNTKGLCIETVTMHKECQTSSARMTARPKQCCIKTVMFITVIAKWNWCVKETGYRVFHAPSAFTPKQHTDTPCKGGIILVIETDFNRNNPTITIYKPTGSFFIQCFLKATINITHRTVGSELQLAMHLGLVLRRLKFSSRRIMR
jgi:hypothetical protein